MGNGDVFYTSVYYPAKSLMDLIDCLTAAGRSKEASALQARVAACLDDLLKRGDNISTEGESTYEDGAIACTALQLAQYSRHHSSTPSDNQFVAAACSIAEGHRCLEYRS